MRQLRGRVSGVALPTYVLDVPGGFGKVPLEGAYVHVFGDGEYAVETVGGRRVEYRDAVG
jgi:lysine 2,3-aminomutase